MRKYSCLRSGLGVRMDGIGHIKRAHFSTLFLKDAMLGTFKRAGSVSLRPRHTRNRRLEAMGAVRLQF